MRSRLIAIALLHLCTIIGWFAFVHYSDARSEAAARRAFDQGFNAGIDEMGKGMRRTKLLNSEQEYDDAWQLQLALEEHGEVESRMSPVEPFWILAVPSALVGAVAVAALLVEAAGGQSGRTVRNAPSRPADAEPNY